MAHNHQKCQLCQFTTTNTMLFADHSALCIPDIREVTLRQVEAISQMGSIRRAYHAECRRHAIIQEGVLSRRQECERRKDQRRKEYQLRELQRREDRRHISVVDELIQEFDMVNTIRDLTARLDNEISVARIKLSELVEARREVDDFILGTGAESLNEYLNGPYK